MFELRSAWRGLLLAFGSRGVSSPRPSRRSRCERCYSKAHATTSRSPLNEGSDRGLRRGQADGQGAYPASGNGAVLDLLRPVRDHHHVARTSAVAVLPAQTATRRQLPSATIQDLARRGPGRSPRVTPASTDSPDATPRSLRRDGHRQPRVHPLPKRQTNAQRRQRSSHQQRPTELRMLLSAPELPRYDAERVSDTHAGGGESQTSHRVGSPVPDPRVPGPSFQCGGRSFSWEG